MEDHGRETRPDKMAEASEVGRKDCEASQPSTSISISTMTAKEFGDLLRKKKELAQKNKEGVEGTPTWWYFHGQIELLDLLLAKYEAIERNERVLLSKLTHASHMIDGYAKILRKDVELFMGG